MLDFPASPTVGQTFQSAQGSTWQWDGVKWTPQTASAPVLSGNVGRNLLHNPTFTVAQRGTGPWTNAGYTADRWNLGYVVPDAPSVTIQPTSDAERTAIGDEAILFKLQNTFAGTSTGAVYIQQPIEKVRRLSGKTLTLSFWCAASASLKLGFFFFQNCGTGGSPSVGTSVTASPVTVGGSWVRYFVTVALPSMSGKTLGTNGDDLTLVRIYYSAGSSAENTNAGGIGVQSGTVMLCGIQLEVGSVATPLDYGGSPQQQLAQCQRFASSVTVSARVNSAGTGGIFAHSVAFPVTMRALPTATVTNAGAISNASTSGSPNLAVNGPGSARFDFSPSAAGDSYVLDRTYFLSADL